MLHTLFARIHPWLQKLLGIDEGLLNPSAEWKLGWENLPSVWVIVLVMIPAVLALSIFVYRFEPEDMSRSKRTILTILRAMALFLLLVMIFQPYLYMEVSLQRENHVGILVDTSKSMSFSDVYNKKSIRQNVQRLISDKNTRQSPKNLQKYSRLDLVNRLFKKQKDDLLTPMQNKQQTYIAPFSDTLLKQQDKPTFTIHEQGNATAIGDSIHQFTNKLRGQQISSILLLTDGQNNAGADPLMVARNISEKRGSIPVYPVAVGNPYQPIDIQLTDLQAPDVVQAGDFVSFQTTLKSIGNYKRKPVVHIKLINQKTDELLQEKKIAIEGTQKETLRWKPEEAGNYPLKILVEPLESEITEENNSLTHSLQVVDEKIRVLYVEGLPRYQFRFLKNAIIRDRSLKVQVLLKSAHKNYVQPSSPDLEPLTEFPGTIEKLAKYDVVIIGDIGPYDLQSPGQDPETNFENLHTFVEELGGGVLFLGGSENNPHDYLNTPIYSLLPVIVDPDSDNTKSNPFHMKLSPIWKQFPILKVLPKQDARQNRLLWETPPKSSDGNLGTPPLQQYIPVEKTRPGARAIAVHPQDTNSKGEPRPIISLQQSGKGRTMFLATDDTWRWRKIVGDRYFYSFYGKVLRWLRGGKLQGNKRYSLSVNQRNYNLGEQVRFKAEILNQNYEPLEEDSVLAHVYAHKTKTEQTVKLKQAEQPGMFKGSFRPKKLGNYRSWIGSLPDNPDESSGEQNYAEESFRVVQKNLETQDPSVNVPLLKDLAQNTGGKFFFFHELPLIQSQSEKQSIPKLVRGKSKSVKFKSRRDGLWDAPLIIILFTLLLGGEWYLRKQSHLI